MERFKLLPVGGGLVNYHKNAVLSSCADYIQVLRNGGSVVTESCGNNTGDHWGLLEERMLCTYIGERDCASP